MLIELLRDLLVEDLGALVVSSELRRRVRHRQVRRVTTRSVTSEAVVVALHYEQLGVPRCRV